MKTNGYQRSFFQRRLAIPALVAAGLLCILAACNKMDYTYKKFLKGGDIIYPGRVDSVRVYPGHNRIKLSWLLTSDPSIVLCRVYWDDRADSVDIPVTKTKDVDSVGIVIDNLKEGYYNFEIYTYDKDGHISVPYDTIGEVFGEVYAASLHNRVIKKSYWDHDSAFIFWYSLPRGAIGSELSYKDADGNTKEVFVSPSDTLTGLPGFVLHNAFEYRTGYVPDSLAIDTFYTDYSMAAVDDTILPPQNLALHMSVDYSSNCGCGKATNLTDGDELTFWQPNSSDRKDDEMVWATIDMGSAQAFNELDQFWTHGHSHIESYKVLYSDDNKTWETAYESDSGPDAGANKASFDTVTARYVKLELYFDTDGNVNIGEIEIWKR